MIFGSTKRSLYQVISSVIPLVDPSSICAVLCIDSVFDSSKIRKVFERFKLNTLSASGPVFVQISEINIDLVDQVFRGYDEIWLVSKFSIDDSFSPLQMDGSSFDLSEEEPPSRFVESFIRNKANLMISDCGIRNVAVNDTAIESDALCLFSEDAGVKHWNRQVGHT